MKTNDWLIKGIDEEDLAIEKVLTQISNAIHCERMNLKKNKKEFSEHMGVTTKKISKWESGNYDFTISELIKICKRLKLTFRYY